MESHLLRTSYEIAPLAASWDDMPASRHDCADIFDSFAWLNAWEGSRRDRDSHPLHVVVAMDGDALVGALPLVNRGRSGFEEAGVGFRPRYRPLLHGGYDSERVSDVLVEGLRRAEIRDLRLVAIPEHGLSFHALTRALGRGGYRVSDWPGAVEYLSPSDGTWDGFRGRFRHIDEQCRRRARKLAALAPVSIDCIRPAADGFPIYLDVHLRSWKGPLSEPWRSFRGRFLEGCRNRDWARLFVLRLGGLSIAVHLWFVVGQNAIWYSGAYDDRFAALSPGMVLLWESIRRIHDTGRIACVDYLPGGTPLKERLAPVRPRLHTLHVSRSRLSIAIRGAGRRARATYHRFRRSGRRSSDERPMASSRAVAFVAFRSVAGELSPRSARPLALNSKVESFLAVSGGFRSLQAMTADWGPEDRWWTVDGEAGEVVALVRTGGAGDALVGIEAILLPLCGITAVQALAAVARAAGAPIRFAERAENGLPGNPLVVRESPIPWPRA